MKFTDGMGYDTHGQPRRTGRSFSWPRVVVVVAVIIVAALIISAIVSATTEPSGSAATAPGDLTPAPRPGSEPSPTAGTLPGSDGHDTEERAGAFQPVWGTFEAFMAAWCSTDPAVRAKGFAATATADLAQGLAETRPENVITAARTKVEVVGAGPYSADFRIWFEDVTGTVHVILVADPGSPHGWRVTAVEKRGD